MSRLRFKRGERLKVIGKHAPFVGERGIFLNYEKEKRETTKVIVRLDSTESEHWFFRDEVSSARAG